MHTATFGQLRRFFVVEEDALTGTVCAVAPNERLAAL